MLENSSLMKISLGMFSKVFRASVVILVSLTSRSVRLMSFCRYAMPWSPIFVSEMSNTLRLVSLVRNLQALLSILLYLISRDSSELIFDSHKQHSFVIPGMRSSLSFFRTSARELSLVPRFNSK